MITLLHRTAGFILISIALYFGFIELFNVINNFSSEWYFIIIALIYTTTINELFLHEILSHSDIRKINLSSMMYKVLSFLVTVDLGYGPIKTFCLSHPNHHIYSDKEADTLNYRKYWFSRCSMSPFVFFDSFVEQYIPDLDKYNDTQKKRYKKLFNDRWTTFLDVYTMPLTIAFWSLLFFVLPIILFKVIFLGRAILTIINIVGSIGGHMKLPFSYRNFNLDDSSHNNMIFYTLTLWYYPGLLHNNHHGISDFSTHQVKWYEIDTSKYVITFLKFAMKQN